MRRQVGILLAISLSFAASLHAQVTLTLSNLPEEELEPGTTRTIVMHAENISGDTLTLRLKNDIPPPLKALLFQTKITLLPGQKKNILVPLSIPRKTGAGNYHLTFSLLNNGTTTVSSKAEIKISKVTEIKVELISMPPYARSIDTIQSRFMISNNGNATEELTLYSGNGDIIGPRKLNIKPDSFIFVDLEIRNDPLTYEVEDQLIDLFCQTSGNRKSVGDQEVIKVYPTRTRKNDPYFRYPVTTNLNYLTQNTNGEFHNNLFQFQINGNGWLDREKHHHLNFSYRGPGAVRITRLGNFSQKYIHYEHSKFNVFVGEKTYGLSNLTENFRFGTGIDLNTTVFKKWAMGGYYNRPLFQPEITEQFGSYVTYAPNKKQSYRINSLNNFLRTGEYVNLTSIGTEFSNSETWQLRTEFSRSFSQEQDGNALSYNTNISMGKLRIASNGLYADSKFQGYYSNSLFASLNTSYNLKKVGFQLNGNYNHANPNLDTVYSTAPISLFTSAGVTTRVSQSFNLQLHALYREKTDRLAVKKFDYEEHRLRFTSSVKRGFFSTRLMAEAGKTFNKLSSGTQSSFGYDAQLQLNYNPKKRYGVALFSQYLQNTRFTNEPSQYLLYGADLYYDYKKLLDLTLEFQNNYLIEDLYNDRNLFNFRMRYNFTPIQSFTAIANYGILHQSPIRREWYISANYVVKLGVPMIKITEFGSIEGKLINQGVSTVDNVVLMLDNQVVTTDEDGNFYFNNIHPGIHKLFIDRSTIGVRDIPEQKLPIDVEIFPEITTEINIVMTRSAKVTGKISLDKSVRVIQSSKKDVVLPSIIVEASNGEESLLTRADMDGNFVFGSLRPGEWKFRMVPTYWKDDFIVKQPFVELTLEAGQEAQVDMTLSPKVRQIKFLNTKTIKVGGNK